MNAYLELIKKYYQQLSIKQKVLFGLPIFSFIALFLFYLMLIIGVFGSIPRQKYFKNLKELEASKIYGSDGVELGKLFEYNKEYTNYSDLPEHLVQALIVTEDKRFYDHSGIDWRSFFRALIKTVGMNQDAGGGSTISQQLVKNVFGRSNSSIYITKLKEMIGAKRLERMYSKEDIIELYLNTIPFGENVYGIHGGSMRFFNKKPKDLSIEESATLIGLLKANTSYNPRINPEDSKTRRNVVLLLMQQNGFLSDEEFEKISKKDIVLDYNATSNDNTMPHYFVSIQNEANQILKDETKRNGEPYNVKRDGLKIYVTINSQLQEFAEKSTKNHISKLQKELYKDWGRVRPWGREPDLLKNAIKNSARYKYLMKQKASKATIEKSFAKAININMYTADGTVKMKISPLDSVKIMLMQLKCSFVAIDNESGGILSYIGSPNYKHFEYDYATAKRQVASTFKPIVFTAAIEKGIKPCNYFENEKITYTDYDNWEPSNYDNKYGGKYSMAGALAKSINVVAVDLLYKAGRKNVIEIAHEMGITTEIPELPSIALGVTDISLVEMVRAFSNYPNAGKNHAPFFIVKIENRAGETLFERESEKPNQAIKAKTAELMVELLKGVVDKGTGNKLRKTYKLKAEYGGKTGTSQSYSDGWFVGFSPYVTAGAWVGADLPQIHFRSGYYGQGSHMALPIFGEYFKSIEKSDSLADYFTGTFPEISKQSQALLNCADYKDKSGLENFFDTFKNRELSDEKLKKKNKRKRFWKSILNL